LLDGVPPCGARLLSEGAEHVVAALNRVAAGAGSAGGGVPAACASVVACSSCAVPTAASRRAIPPSAFSASTRRSLPLLDNSATSDGSDAVPVDAVPDDGAPDGGAGDGLNVPDASAVERGPGAELAPAAGPEVAPPGRRSALACVVSKVTACENSCRRAPDEPFASCWLAALKARVSARAAVRACSEKEGAAGAGDSRGIRAKPRLSTRKAASASRVYRR